MKAMIFAAGMGTRLKPLTDTMPKALVPVCGKPLIEHVSRRLCDAGFKEAVVNVHHFADMVEEWISRQDWMDFKVSDERKLLLETGGAVLHARRFLEGCGSFLIHNVDILTNADLGWFASQHRPDALATLLVSPRKTSRHFLFRRGDMRLAGWSNSITGETVMADPSVNPDDCLSLGFSGIHIMSDTVFPIMDEYVRKNGIPENGDAGVRFPIRDFYLSVAAGQPVYGVNLESFRMLDVGKLDTLGLAEEFVASL